MSRLPMIPDVYKKVKAWAGERQGDLFTATVIFLVGLGSFGLGRLSALQRPKQPITVLPPRPAGRGGADASSAATKEGAFAAKAAATTAGKYVGSKSGTSYHLPWCPGALRIKETNKIWFPTKKEAEAKGYNPAGNCPGL